MTTNHIAAACGISPGNLYYHFRNKEEIIREIFAQIARDFSELWQQTPDELPDFNKVARDMPALYYRYRFFYLELPTLLARDSELSSMYHDNQRLKHVMISTLIDGMVTAGLARKFSSDAERESWIINSWIISDFWLSYLAISGLPVTEENIARGLLQFFSLLRPCLTRKGASMIDLSF